MTLAKKKRHQKAMRKTNKKARKPINFIQKIYNKITTTNLTNKII
tara:strand:- start:151 stop:285 length:135 start_codon:yes stop_codon:yes gene_type:complete